MAARKGGLGKGLDTLITPQMACSKESWFKRSTCCSKRLLTTGDYGNCVD